MFDAFVPLAGGLAACLSRCLFGNMFWCLLIALCAEFFLFQLVYLSACVHTAIALVIIVLFRTNSYAIDNFLIVG